MNTRITWLGTKKFTLSKHLSQLKFLTDECLGLPTILILKNSGCFVVTAKEVGLGGKSDSEILKWAIKENCVVVTEDLDLGNILLYPPSLHRGVILLRFRHSDEKEIHIVLARLLKDLKVTDFKGSLIVVDHDKYRIHKK